MTSKHSTALVAVLGIGCIFLTACKPRDAKPTESATSAPVATGSPSPAVSPHAAHRSGRWAGGCFARTRGSDPGCPGAPRPLTENPSGWSTLRAC
jgi:hypothetical protein